ncbi:MAG: FAD-dependent oxidoreductase [Chloroflexi bacterium]|nr:FAD-dependent oxidoreductase [Chloroflexota bacterium]
MEKLFEPGKIARMELKNRLCMAPMGTSLAGPQGEISQRMIEYYRARARGGVGLVITEIVMPEFNPARALMFGTGTPAVGSAGNIRLFTELAEAVHDYGAKIAIQLTCGNGRLGGLEDYPEVQAVSPSPVPTELAPNRIPRELTVSEIEYIVAAQGKAAAKLKRANIDAIEIHAHGGYLMAQFMSPIVNKRTDKYGGDLDGRLRFPLESIQAIKAAAGNDFPLIFRYAIDEFVEGGRGIAESQEVARRLEAAGVHAIDISGGAGGFRIGSSWVFPPSYLPEGTYVHLAEAIKKAVKIPVITAGRLGDCSMASRVLEDGNADFISLGRPVLCDPDLPRKWATGHPEEVRRCISCNVCQTRGGGYIHCALNPLAGRELAYHEPQKAERKKKVMVIGAGPGGMEAARVAALRGHDVVLYEKTKQLGGGQLKIAMVPPHKDDLQNIIDYYDAQFKKLKNVTVRLGAEANADLVKKEKPDAVVIAVGNEPIIPDLPGVTGRNAVTAEAVLAGEAKVGSSAVVIGAGMVGCETANYLAQQGKAVTILSRRDASQSAIDVPVHHRTHLLRMLAEKSVKIIGPRTVVEITNQGVVTEDAQKKREVVPADTVVLARGRKPLTGLVSEIAKMVDEYTVIGDAKETRSIKDAIWEGFRYCNEL